MMVCNPFRPQTRICQAAHYADDLVEDQFQFELRAAVNTQHLSRVSPFRTGEETFTELLLPRLGSMFSDVVWIETFNKKTMEPKYGADWLWVLDFGQRLIPMLVQAKRTREVWEGDQDWTVDIAIAQKQTIEAMATKLNVSSQFCIYAPSWAPCRFCLPLLLPSFVHLLPTIFVRQRSFQAGESAVVQHMVPFTCFCCCFANVDDAGKALKISPETFRESGELESLIVQAREQESIEGAVVLKMGGD